MKFTNYLVECVNSGLNILFTTHSDYITDKINNCILLNSVSDDILEKKFPESKRVFALNHEDFNIYNFKFENPYSAIAYNVKLYATGFSDDGFADSSRKVHEETVELVKAIGDKFFLI